MQRKQHRAQYRPLGAPQSRGAADEENSQRWTEKLLSVKYDWNHLKAMPLMPTHCSSLDERIEWLTVFAVYSLILPDCSIQ